MKISHSNYTKLRSDVRSIIMWTTEVLGAEVYVTQIKYQNSLFHALFVS